MSTPDHGAAPARGETVMQLVCDHCGKARSIESHGAFIGEACHLCGIGYWRVRPAAVPSGAPSGE